MQPVEDYDQVQELVAVIGRDTMYRTGVCSVLQKQNIRFVVSDLIIPSDTLHILILIEPSLDFVSKVSASFPTSILFVIHGRDTRFEALVKAGASVGCSTDTPPEGIVFLVRLTTMEIKDAFVYPHRRVAATGDSRMIMRAATSGSFGEFGLTNAESAVINELVKGSSNKIIAHQLRLTESTIKAHVRSIFRKMDVKSRSGATSKWSNRSGL